jgi:flagellar secretion chaperone FliS
MTYATQAAQYREMQVMTASPEQLVVILYDHLLVCLRRTRLAVETAAIDSRIELLDKSRRVLAELLVTLNHEKGGTIARDLAALYAFLLNELSDVGRNPSVPRIDRITSIATELRDAFAVAAGEQAETA